MRVLSGFQRKVLVIFVLLICFAPSVKGLQCLSCSTEERTSNYDANCGITDPEKTETCAANAVGCSFIVEPVEKYIRRECISTAYVTCTSKIFKKALVDGECVMFRDLTALLWENFTNCETELSNVEKPATGSEGEAELAGSPAEKEIIQQGPGSRSDIIKMEVCFCQGEKCNTNNIKPKTTVILEELDDGTGSQLGGCLFLIVIASGLSLMLKWTY